MSSPWYQNDLDPSRTATPRPEYPRPDFRRGASEGFDWINLNGVWAFEFDADDRGEREEWYRGAVPFSQSIVVPFPWESHLAWDEGHLASNENWYSTRAFLDPDTVDNSNYIKQPRHEIGWYLNAVTIPVYWSEKRTILHFGAVDWQAKVWINGQLVGTHEDGYSPFSFDITDACRAGETAFIAVRVYDPNNHRAQTAGKQIDWYARTSGIWQTPFLEPRPATHISRIHIVPDIDACRASVRVDIDNTLQADTTVGAYRLRMTITAPDGRSFEHEGPYDTQPVEIDLPHPLLWEPDTPHLYEARVELLNETEAADCVRTSFGMRKVSVDMLPGTTTNYIFLNNHPMYLLGALNQSFNPWGVYTFPSDAAIQDDLRRTRAFGFNFLRIHIKIEDPRFLYWADRMGVLLMCDIPNFDTYCPEAHERWENTLRAAIDRDYNHPSIISWCCFNETWGLGDDSYKTQSDRHEWVESMYRLTRSLDPTRLVEDNSPCMYDHVETQINSWHFYINDYGEARAHIAHVVEQTYPGSEFNYVEGHVQGDEPLMNSEYGGISAGAGDKDVSWCFKYLTNELRLHEKICGYIYTELQDIEWEHNGFMNYDRTAKEFGYDYRILNTLDVVLLDGPPGCVAPGGSRFGIDVVTSHFSSKTVDNTRLRWRMDSVDHWGDEHEGIAGGLASVSFSQYRVEKVHHLDILLPHGNQLCTLHVWIEDACGAVLARNFTTIEIHDSPLPTIDYQENHLAIRYDVNSYEHGEWLGGIEENGDMVSGRGTGAFEYLVELPDGMDINGVNALEVWAELSAGREDACQTEPQRFPSEVILSVNGVPFGITSLSDAPADTRGALSYIHGIPGRYGELVRAVATDDDLARIFAGISNNRISIRYEVIPNCDKPHGATLFGARAGRYPVQPCVVLRFE